MLKPVLLVSALTIPFFWGCSSEGVRTGTLIAKFSTPEDAHAALAKTHAELNGKCRLEYQPIATLGTAEMTVQFQVRVECVGPNARATKLLLDASDADKLATRALEIISPKPAEILSASYVGKFKKDHGFARQESIDSLFDFLNEMGMFSLSTGEFSALLPESEIALFEKATDDKMEVVSFNGKLRSLTVYLEYSAEGLGRVNRLDWKVK